MILRAICLSFAFIMGCGSQREVEPTARFPDKPGQVDSEDEANFADVQDVTNKYCLRCHATSKFLKTEKGWDASEAQARLTARTMPPAGTNESKSLSDSDRSFLISF